MWLTASVSAASLGMVIWAILAKRTAARRGETLRETLGRQWRKAAEDTPDVIPPDVKQANQLTVADELDGGRYDGADGNHGDSGGDFGHH